MVEKSLLEANWHLHSQCLDNLPHKLSWQHQVSQRFHIRLVKELVQSLLDMKVSSTYPCYLCGVGRRRCVPWSATERKTLPTKTSQKKRDTMRADMYDFLQPKGKIQKWKIIVKSAMLFCVLVLALKFSILALASAPDFVVHCNFTTLT